MRKIVINWEIVHELWSYYINNINLNDIENKLTINMNENDMKNFLSELYSKYKLLKKEFEQNIVNEIKDYSKLEVTNKYFIGIFYHKYYYNYSKIIELEKFLKIVEEKIFVYDINFKLKRNIDYKIDINSISITDIIGKYIKLSDNLQRNIKCPFIGHNDKTPSFHIYIKTNSFCCFWCGVKGNAINFIAEIENVSNKEAFKIIKNLFFK